MDYSEHDECELDDLIQRLSKTDKSGDDFGDGVDELISQISEERGLWKTSDDFIALFYYFS